MQDFEASDGVVTTNTATMYIATRMGRSVLAQSILKLSPRTIIPVDGLNPDPWEIVAKRTVWLLVSGQPRCPMPTHLGNSTRDRLAVHCGTVKLRRQMKIEPFGWS